MLDLFEKMRHRNLYKNYIRESLLGRSDGFFVLNMNNVYDDDAISQRLNYNKKV